MTTEKKKRTPRKNTAYPNRRIKAQPRALLTEQERLFVDNFVKTKSATRAYMAAYGGDISKAYGVGVRMLRVPYIAEAISAAFVSSHIEVSAPLVVQELARIAFVDISRAYDEAGRFLPLNVMPPEVRKAISSIKTTDHGMEVKFWGKPDALDKLARHFKLYVNDPLKEDEPVDPAEEMSDIEVARRIVHILTQASQPST